MKSKVQEAYKDILKDPELYDSIVENFVKNTPGATPEQVHVYIVKLISEQLSQEADEDKKRRQLDIARSRVLSRALETLPDTSQISMNKYKIKESLSKISNSGNDSERENVADLLKDFSETHQHRLDERRKTSESIRRRK